MTFEAIVGRHASPGALAINDGELGDGSCPINNVGGDFNLDALDDSDISGDDDDPTNILALEEFFGPWEEAADGRPVQEKISSSPLTYRGSDTYETIIGCPRGDPTVGARGGASSLRCVARRSGTVRFRTGFG